MLACVTLAAGPTLAAQVAPAGCYRPGVDALSRDDLEDARNTSPSEKARQALELMDLGIRLKQAALRSRHPDASDSEIEALLQAWLDRADD